MKIEALVADFLNLLNTCRSEEEIQEFLCQYTIFVPKFLEAQTGVFSKVKLGSDFVTDFAFGYYSTAGTSWWLIEIKRPDYRLFTKSSNISAHLSHALTQVAHWRSWVARNYVYAERILPSLINLNTIIVIGRRKSLSDKDMDLLAQLNQEMVGREIMTFDRLADDAVFYSNFGELERIPSALTFKDLLEHRFLIGQPVRKFRRSENERGDCWFRIHYYSKETHLEWIKCVVSDDNRCHYPKLRAADCPNYPETLKKEL